MRRDVLITLGGLAVVALVVVATFMYGNQRRASENKATPAASPPTAQQAKPAPAAPGPSAARPAETKPKVITKDNSQTAKGGVVKSNPATGPMPQQTPATGEEALVVLPVLAVLVLIRQLRTTKQSIRLATLST